MIKNCMVSGHVPDQEVNDCLVFNEFLVHNRLFRTLLVTHVCFVTHPFDIRTYLFNALLTYLCPEVETMIYSISCMHVCAAVKCDTSLLPNISGAFIAISGVSYQPQQQFAMRFLVYSTVVTYQCNDGLKFEDGYSSHQAVCNQYGIWTAPDTAITCTGETQLDSIYMFSFPSTLQLSTSAQC